LTHHRPHPPVRRRTHAEPVDRAENLGEAAKQGDRAIRGGYGSLREAPRLILNLARRQKRYPGRREDATDQIRRLTVGTALRRYKREDGCPTQPFFFDFEWFHKPLPHLIHWLKLRWLLASTYEYIEFRLAPYMVSAMRSQCE